MKLNVVANQGARVIFILPYLMFMFFVIFVSINLASTSAENQQYVIGNSSYNFSYSLNQSSVQGSGGTLIRPPICDLSGWGIITNVFGLKCVADYLGMFIGLAFLNSGFAILNILVFTPLGIIMIWLILEVLRGSG